MTTTTTSDLAARARELGNARLDAVRKAEAGGDWKELWTEPQPFPFAWGECWKQSVEYYVDDFAAEIGFFVDILGLPTNAAGSDFMMFTSPEKDFFFNVRPAGADQPATPANTLTLQFMVDSVPATADKLRERGIAFEQEPKPMAEGSPMRTAVFATPAGVKIWLWGMERG